MSDIDRGTDARVDGARTRASAVSRRTANLRRRLAGSPRRSIALLALPALLATVGVALGAPSGSFDLTQGTDNTNGLVKFGPINPDHGFPDWYRDSNDVELELCVDARDPNCNAPPVPNPDAAPSFPGNFPDEAFYMLADANLTAAGGNPVLAEYAVEGAFGGGPVKRGDQMVFGRTRYRIRGGLQGDTTYKVTNPYGVDYVRTDAGATELFTTEDVGAAVGAFGAVFGGQVGPFLQWTDGEAPAGYIGDPAVPHAVTGSPYNTNFVMIEGPGIGGANNPNPCPDLTPQTSPDCIYTAQFSLTGKRATRGGVEVARAAYSRTADGRSIQLDALAESKSGEDIVVQDPQAGPTRRFPDTALRADGGRYFAHLDVQGALPSTVDVVNRSDVPKTVKHVPVIDQLTGTASYDADTGALTVQAASSDKTGTPVLKVETTGNTPIPATGVVTIPTAAPADSVRVVSSRGGAVSLPVDVHGAGMPPLKLTANAGADQVAEQGVTVKLDGTASSGNIDSYKWVAPDGVTLEGGDTATPTFKAPLAEGDLTFTLEVTGPDGSPAATTTVTDQVTVHVNALQDAAAKIAFAGNLTTPGTAITVDQNLPLTLDATQSVGAAAFAWTQVSGAPVDLGTADGPTVTFTFPKTDGDVVLRLTVRHPDAAAAECAPPECSSTEVTLSPQPDTLGVTRARYVANSSRWVITGTASSRNRNNVQVYSGLSLDPSRKIGSGPVLADGSWSVDVRDSSVPVTTCNCVTVVSDRGGQVSGFELEKPQNLPDTGIAPTIAGAPTTQTVSAASFATGLTRLSVPATVTAGALAAPGVRVTLGVPAGTGLVRLRVLTTAGAPLFQTFKKVRGGATVKVKVRSAKLRRKVRSGKRYVIEVRAGKSRARLGKATRKTIRVR